MQEINSWILTHLNDIIYVVAVLLGAILLSRISKLVIERYISRSTKLLKSDPTNFRFLKNSISVIIFIAALLLIIYHFPGGKALAVSLFASAGIFAAIIGFASQEAFSNIVGGLFIVIFKPFRVEDRILVGVDKAGTVEDITLRHTVIRDFNNRRIIIPNSVVSSETVTNSTITDQKI